MVRRVYAARIMFFKNGVLRTGEKSAFTSKQCAYTVALCVASLILMTAVLSDVSVDVFPNEVVAVE